MREELATILRLVSDGTLSAEEAGPIIDALTRPTATGSKGAPAPTPEPGRNQGRGRRVRIQVSERGRRVVDIRIPLAFAAVAARMVPGISDNYAVLIQQAVETDTVGPIVDAEDEDGNSVLISVE